MVWLSFILAVGFVVIHIASKNMRFLDRFSRSQYLSFSGGVTISFVFAVTLPDLNKHQKHLQNALDGKMAGLVENQAYIVAMLGLLFFYGLDWIVECSRKRDPDLDEHEVRKRFFWLHMASFFVYNSLIGYLLLRGYYGSARGMILYFLALSVHMVSNDRALRETHPNSYDRSGRMLLSFSVLLGWLVGIFATIPKSAISLIFAVLSGGMILNTLKEQLPADRKSNFLSFAGGCLGYTLLWLAAPN